MVYWALAGLVAGGAISLGRPGSPYNVLTLIVGSVALVLVAAIQRFEVATLLSYGAFWVAAQVAWFVGGLVRDSLHPVVDAEGSKNPSAPMSSRSNVKEPDWDRLRESRRSSSRSAA